MSELVQVQHQLNHWQLNEFLEGEETVKAHVWSPAARGPCDHGDDNMAQQQARNDSLHSLGCTACRSCRWLGEESAEN